MNNQKDILKVFDGDFNLILTKKEIKERSGVYYYYNTDKHLGDMLGRMVKNGALERVKRGSYKLGKGKRKSNQIENKKQLKLF